jgi:2-succinyl-6-hydroxy-2,4-cyclohexadiene-1-carboxylate synthase
VTAKSAIEHREIDVGEGLRLHIAISGSGSPLVLLHGFTGSAETWRDLRSGTEKNHTVVAVDFPGHGRSTSPPDPRRYALDRFAGDLVRVLDILGIGKTAFLGYSMGGRAALRCALSNRDRVAALILESSSPGISDSAVREVRRTSDDSMADTIERDGLEAFVARWEQLPLWTSQKSLPETARDRLRAQRLDNQPFGLANSLRGAGAAMDLPVNARLSELHVPTLVIAGELDTAYVEIARTMSKSIPNARTAIVPRSGHAVHLEQPDAFANVITEFLEGVQTA